MNSLNNDGKSIYQDIINPMLHTCIINDIVYNLVKIEFTKSNLTYNNKNVGLELHLIHRNYNNINNHTIILPLDFITIETFINISDFTEISKISNTLLKKTKNIKKFLKNHKFNLDFIYKRNYDIKKISVNNLVDYLYDIPQYECCGVIIGKLKNIQLCQIQKIVNEMSDFKIINKNNNIYYITEPVPINPENGFNILNNIE
jgi:hypothetical protein